MEKASRAAANQGPVTGRPVSPSQIMDYCNPGQLGRVMRQSSMA
jgi:hypothetical protein